MISSLIDEEILVYKKFCVQTSIIRDLRHQEKNLGDTELEKKRIDVLQIFLAFFLQFSCLNEKLTMPEKQFCEDSGWNQCNRVDSDITILETVKNSQQE